MWLLENISKTEHLIPEPPSLHWVPINSLVSGSALIDYALNSLEIVSWL